ncbi:MAG TPA: GNAT family N-acetyltransferase [Chlamydiales bacterium]|nr:GNAT family N-acetyltransferase [Chlamydiales bacterium]
MQITFHQEKGFTDPIKEWQEKHTKRLKGPIDVFWLNHAIYGGSVFSIHSTKPIGYCVITKNKELSELFLEDPNDSPQAIASLLKEKRIASSIVSTRNPYLLSLCMDFHKSAQSIAYLFLDLNRDLHPQKRLTFRIATQEDKPWIENKTDYERDLIIDLSEGLLFILLDGNTRLGHGTLSPNPLQPHYSDIGCWVDPVHRSKGYGCEIILHLKKVCYDRSILPTCGCDLENLSSKRMLEKSGFYASDRMVKMIF